MHLEIRWPNSRRSGGSEKADSFQNSNLTISPRTHPANVEVASDRAGKGIKTDSNLRWILETSYNRGSRKNVVRVRQKSHIFGRWCIYFVERHSETWSWVAPRFQREMDVMLTSLTLNLFKDDIAEVRARRNAFCVKKEVVIEFYIIRVNKME